LRFGINTDHDIVKRTSNDRMHRVIELGLGLPELGLLSSSMTLYLRLEYRGVGTQPLRKFAVLLSTVETSCTTNPQKIEVIELEGYSWQTCSKQPRLVDCRIGVVNKLGRRRRRQVLFTTRSPCRGEVFQVRSSGQSSRGKHPNYWRYLNFFITHDVWWKEASVPKTSSIRPVCRYSTGLWRSLQTDRKRHDTIKYRASIASRGKMPEFLNRNWRSIYLQCAHSRLRSTYHGTALTVTRRGLYCNVAVSK